MIVERIEALARDEGHRRGWCWRPATGIPPPGASTNAPASRVAAPVLDYPDSGLFGVLRKEPVACMSRH